MVFSQNVGVFLCISALQIMISSNEINTYTQPCLHSIGREVLNFSIMYNFAVVVIKITERFP